MRYTLRQLELAEALGEHDLADTIRSELHDELLVEVPDPQPEPDDR